MTVHLLATSGTLDQLSYTACGRAFDQVERTLPKLIVERYGARVGEVTCRECLQRGPRQAPRLPPSGLIRG